MINFNVDEMGKAQGNTEEMQSLMEDLTGQRGLRGCEVWNWTLLAMRTSPSLSKTGN
jgi:hypothetical protein